jgi:hypothetical protein
MPPHKRVVVAVPSAAALPHSLRLPRDDPSVLKTLNRVPRSALLTIILDWLDEKNQPLCRPYLTGDADGDGDDDDPGGFPAAASAEELREQYLEIQASRESRKRLVERVIYGDWVRVSLAPTTACCALLLGLDADCYASETWVEPLSSGNGGHELSVLRITPRPAPVWLPRDIITYFKPTDLLARPGSQKWISLKLCRVVASSTGDQDNAEMVEDLTAAGIYPSALWICSISTLMETPSHERKTL